VATRQPDVSANEAGNRPGRNKVLAFLFKSFSLILLAAVAFVLLDFAIDLRPSNIQSSYRFEVGELAPDEVKILRQDNLSILVVRRSAATIASLRQSTAGLQDPESQDSRQPDYARNALRSRQPQYFVSYGMGTDLGCTLEVLPSGLREICSGARYDLAGRALKGTNKFPNLAIPDYNFAVDFSSLTVKP
jgi:ubiquinol-cytochrome c reductase iron-sulfur subunit